MTTYIGTPGDESGELQPLVVLDKATIAADIVRFVLAHPDGEPLLPFSAGSHVVVVTPNGLARRYSLSNSPAERERYVIAVKREPDGGGGSAIMSDDVRVGMKL